MPLHAWNYTALDADLAREIQSRLPDRLFDAHAHLYRVADLRSPVGSLCREGPEVAGVEVWQRHTNEQVGASRCTAGLFFALPYVEAARLDGANDFVLSELKDRPDSRALIVIHPEYPREQAEACLEQSQVAGFKVYHTWSPHSPTFSASPDSFIPEWAWQLADDRRLVILLHLVKPRSLADPDNQRYLRKMCDRYPQAQVILAHAARGFHAPDTIRGLPALHGLGNIWFDTSAVCESSAIEAIFDTFGPRRLMWGSDFPVSQICGKCITLGDGFAWLDADTVNWERIAPLASPTLVGLESLRALLHAMDSLGLSADDARNIFFANAARLIGVEKDEDGRTRAAYERARSRIPGGTQLLSKRPEMMAPGQWPAYFQEARGCEVWDLDGRHYYDFTTIGIGSCLLGYRDPDVTRAVRRRLLLGSMCTLNPPEELELADLLCEIHPWAEQVRFARTGGEAVAVAVRIARATTGRSAVAICGYHGWHDWYLAANLGDSERLSGHLLPGLPPAGVPQELRQTTFPFRYNAIDELRAIIRDHGQRLAAIVMEPCRFQPPQPGFLEQVRQAAEQAGALLIFDEITIGWRLCYGGAHLRFGVRPDLAVFAKALGNGHPVAAVIGTRRAMEGANLSFISSTYWTESRGARGARAAREKRGRRDGAGPNAPSGERVQNTWRKAADQHKLPVVVGDGFACLCHFRFEHELSLALQTLYTQWMLENGFLAGPAFYPTLAHTDDVVARFERAVDDVFSRIRRSLDTGRVKDDLRGPVAHSGFRRLT